MNFKRNIVFILLIIILINSFSCIKMNNTEVEHFYFKKELTNRFEKTFHIKLNIPDIIISDTIISNAQYKNNIITLGKRFFSDEYFTNEDRLSILFHEYVHYLNDQFGIYQYKKDEDGNILQTETDQFYEKYLSQIEFQIDMKNMKASGISENQLNIYKKEAELPVYMRFIYAPSNLSREELLCYLAEVTCNKYGLFNHSSLYKSILESRIKLEKMHLYMRLKYEKENQLNSDGTSIKN